LISTPKFNGDVTGSKTGPCHSQGIAKMDLSRRLALFIDGQNLYFTAKNLGFDVDFKRLLAHFATKGILIRAFYYTTILEEQEFSVTRPLTDWLDYNGFTVRTKLAKEFDDGNGRRKIKRNVAIELAVDALGMARHLDQIVLVTGDGDFRSVVEAVQRRGVHVTVVSTVRTKPPMIGDELRRQADAFLELDDLKNAIGRAVA
jgi:uncharacterized LabA/DUF88 family protein